MVDTEHQTQKEAQERTTSGLTIEGLAETFATAELRGGLCRWFAQLRWGAVVGAAFTIIIASALGARLPVGWLLSLLALVALYNLVFLYLTDPRRPPPP